MGMYTQIRGWLNVDSIGSDENYDEIKEILEDCKEDYYRNTPTDRGTMVSEATIINRGSNGSVFVFIGTELKNYDEDGEKWIRHLLAFLPNAEGRIDFQYEEECRIEERIIDNKWNIDLEWHGSKYWLIYKGKIIKEDRCPTWCEGYGNFWKDDDNG